MLSVASGQQVTVDYEDADTGTATSGDDYTAITAGTLTFAAGVTRDTLAVTVLADALDEENETVVVELSNPVNATINTATGTGTITDDDDEPTLSIASASVAEGTTGATPSLEFIVTLSAASGRQVTVDYEDAGTGTATSGHGLHRNHCWHADLSGWRDERYPCRDCPSAMPLMRMMRP